MNTHTIIWTVISKYKYKYEYLSHTKPKINMLLYIYNIVYIYKPIQVGKNNAYMCHSLQFMVFH